MTKLETLYTSIKGFEELGMTLTEDILKQADEMEEQLIKTEVLPKLSKDIEPLLSQIQRELVLVVEYKPGEPISVSLSRNNNIREKINAKPLTQAVSVPVTSTKTAKPTTRPLVAKRYGNGTKGLKVTFPDGTVIWHTTSIDTFTQTIRKIGLEKVSKLNIFHSGYNLVSRKKRPAEYGVIWQHYVDGWYIYANIDNIKKIKDLGIISDSFHLKLKIEEVKPKY